MANEPHPPQDENHVIAERRAKLKAMREKGNPYPNDFLRGHIAADLHEQYENHDRDFLDLNPVPVDVAGRLMLR